MVFVGAICLPPTGELSELPLEVVESLLSQDGSVSAVGVASTDHLGRICLCVFVIKTVRSN